MRCICVAIGLLLLHSKESLAEPEMIWLRPKDPGVVVEGVTITGGDQFAIMRYLSSFLPQYKHRYESYPVKRSWALIQQNQSQELAYCFIGAALTKEREKWGYFSLPTSIGLPYPVVARKGELTHIARDNLVSVGELFEQHYTTVLYDGIENIWVRTVNALQPPSNALLFINAIDTNLNHHTMDLLAKGRIDFGYISHKALQAMDKDQRKQIDVFFVRELAKISRRISRILCSKSPLGQSMVDDIDKTLKAIATNPEQSAQFRELNFKALGYHPSLSQTYQASWQSLFVIAAD